MGEADARADEGRDAVPGAEIDVAVEQPDARREVAVGNLVRHAAKAVAGVEIDAVDGLDVRGEAVLAGDVGAEPAVKLVADAAPCKGAAAKIFLDELHRGLIGARELA